MLGRLGYAVTRHVGGVHGPSGPSVDEMTNHLVLTVHDLPTDDNPGGSWYVDTGTGDAMHGPLPLRPGRYRDGDIEVGVEAVDNTDFDWHLTHDPRGAFTGMAWRDAPAADMSVFADRHTWIATAPESGFVKMAIAQRRDARGVDALKGCVLSRLEHEWTSRTIETQREYFAVLADVFAITDITGGVADALWTRTRNRHDRWVASQQS